MDRNYTNAVAQAVAVGESDAVFVTGTFQGELDFDPGPGTDTQGFYEWRGCFLTKYAADGSYNWTRKFPCTDGGGSSVAVDYQTVDAGVYVTGTYYREGDFDPTTGEDIQYAQSGDVFLTKYTQEGSYEWTRSLGGNQGDYGLQVTVDQDNTLYLIASVSGRLDLDPGVGFDLRTAGGYYDLLSARYDVSGRYLGAYMVGGPTVGGAWKLITDTSENMLVLGWYQGQVDFDPTSGFDLREGYSFGDQNIFGYFGGSFLSKYNAEGEYQFTITLDTFNGRYEFFSLTTDDTGNIYVQGLYQGTVDFDPGVRVDKRTSIGGVNFFVSKYSPDGGYLWTKTFGQGVGVWQIAYVQGRIELVGTFSGVVDLNPDAGVETHDGGSGATLFITSLDQTGVFLRSRVIEGEHYSNASVSFSSEGDIVLAGSFSGTVKFNPNNDTEHIRVLVIRISL